MARSIEELPLYSKILEFWDAVFAMLTQSRLRRNRKLYDQIDSANDSIEANMFEGFQQPSDAAFARFVSIAKGSLEEVRSRTRQAHRKRLVTDHQRNRVEELGEPLAKMMGGFIKYLQSSGFTDRGRHTVAPRPHAIDRNRSGE
jgi:four helix bundle protein